MLAKARCDANVSQAELARLLDVDTSTIKRWESEQSKISLEKALEGFAALHIPMYPYLMSALYSSDIQRINEGSDISYVKRELNTLVKELDDFHLRELLFILKGMHGSSPTGTLDMMTAYLHLPLATRVCVTENILNTYEISEATGSLVNDMHILPKTETLRKCTAAAKKAVIEGKNTYCSM